jgi:hypothetical protein
MISYSLAEKTGQDADRIHSHLMDVDQESHMIMMPGYVFMSYQVPGKDIMNLTIMRTKRGALFSHEPPAVHAGFVLLFSRDEKDQYLHTIMWMNGISGGIDFQDDWKKKKRDELRDLVLEASKELKIRGE